MIDVCVLCGELITRLHWTDQSIDSDHSNTVIVGGDDRRDEMRNRLRRVAIVDVVIGFYGLKLGDWNGIKYIISDKKGNTKIINNLSEIWFAADELLKSSINPLDPDLLLHLANLRQ